MELKATRLSVSDGVGVIHLHRPLRLNAWTGRMHTEYRWCLAQLDQDPAAGAIIVTGSGRGFCVGGDSEALAGHVRRGAYDAGIGDDLARPGFGVSEHFDADFAYHFGLSKPVLAAINGPAAGVGLALACFADLRFAAPGVKLTTAHGKLNLPAEYGLSWILPRLIGLGRANDLLLTSRVFVSEEAERLGLVNAVTPAAELMSHCMDYARSLIATVSPNALQQTRWQIYRDLHGSAAASVRRSVALIGEMMREDDFVEGVAALRGKRPPVWGGNNAASAPIDAE